MTEPSETALAVVNDLNKAFVNTPFTTPPAMVKAAHLIDAALTEARESGHKDGWTEGRAPLLDDLAIEEDQHHRWAELCVKAERERDELRERIADIDSRFAHSPHLGAKWYRRIREAEAQRDQAEGIAGRLEAERDELRAEVERLRIELTRLGITEARHHADSNEHAQRVEELDAENEALRAALARVEALADWWAEKHCPRNVPAYYEGRYDQLDICEQEVRAALDGTDTGSET